MNRKLHEKSILEPAAYGAGVDEMVKESNLQRRET